MKRSTLLSVFSFNFTFILLLILLLSPTSIHCEQEGEVEVDETELLLNKPTSTSVKSLTSVSFPLQVTPSNPSAYLIEFYQPWCPHCQDFAKTWQSLCDIKVHLEDQAKFKLRRVNCEENGDLCAKEGIKGYPHIGLYFDGRFVEKYGGE